MKLYHEVIMAHSAIYQPIICYIFGCRDQCPLDAADLFGIVHQMYTWSYVVLVRKVKWIDSETVS